MKLMVVYGLTILDKIMLGIWPFQDTTGTWYESSEGIRNLHARLFNPKELSSRINGYKKFCHWGADFAGKGQKDPDAELIQPYWHSQVLRLAHQQRRNENIAISASQPRCGSHNESFSQWSALQQVCQSSVAQYGGDPSSKTLSMGTHSPLDQRIKPNS